MVEMNESCSTIHGLVLTCPEATQGCCLAATREGLETFLSLTPQLDEFAIRTCIILFGPIILPTSKFAFERFILVDG